MLKEKIKDLQKRLEGEEEKKCENNKLKEELKKSKVNFLIDSFIW